MTETSEGASVEPTQDAVFTNPDTGIEFCGRCGQEVPHECLYPNNPVLGVLTGNMKVTGSVDGERA